MKILFHKIVTLEIVNIIAMTCESYNTNHYSSIKLYHTSHLYLVLFSVPVNFTAFLTCFERPEPRAG